MLVLVVTATETLDPVVSVEEVVEVQAAAQELAGGSNQSSVLVDMVHCTISTFLFSINVFKGKSNSKIFIIWCASCAHIK
jgi:hypothetical protein